jgi:hypothetical protein
MKGLNKTVTLAMIMTTVGLWINYLFDLPTVSIVFIGVAMPLLGNSCTKVSALWFGPKARNLTTTILLIAFYIPNSLEEFLEEKILPANIYITVFSTILTPLCLLLIYDRPDFSPTMGEEEKRNNAKLTFSEQLKLLKKNSNFLYVCTCSALILICNN